MRQPTHDTAENDRDGQLEWEIEANRHCQNRNTEAMPLVLEPRIDRDDDHGQKNPQSDHVPRHTPVKYALGHLGHQGSLGCFERVRVICGGYTNAIGIEQQGEGRGDHHGCR